MFGRTKPKGKIENIVSVSLGCDPEFFFSRQGKIIGAEKVINQKTGLEVGGATKVIVDGVQCELNPETSTCRQSLARNIGYCFQKLAATLDKETKIDFSSTIKITKEELDTLSDEAKIFGCAPSKNTKKANEDIVKLKDPSTYLYRSAGGHIHLGFSPKYDTEKLVSVLDVLVGNTCVLIDRDESNIERRKVYGRAGEYREPEYGLEYRTLSNFWLRSYPLMSFVFSLARYSVRMVASSTNSNDFAGYLLSLVDIDKVHAAINNNDFDLAYENFVSIQPALFESSPHNDPLTPGRLVDFEYFFKKGLDHWFKDDPMKHWLSLGNPFYGWEAFLQEIVHPQRIAEETEKLYQPFRVIKYVQTALKNAVI